jgi:hypothetical protein
MMFRSPSFLFFWLFVACVGSKRGVRKFTRGISLRFFSCGTCGWGKSIFLGSVRACCWLGVSLRAVVGLGDDAGVDCVSK